MKKRFDPLLDSELTENWDEADKVVFGLKAMTSIPYAREAFRGAIYATLLVEEDMDASFSNTIEYFTMFLENKNMEIIPGVQDKDSDTYAPRYVATSPDYGYKHWRTPESNKNITSEEHNANIWDTLIQVGSPANRKEIAWDVISRNFSKLPAMSGHGKLTVDDIRPAFDRVMKTVQEINADHEQKDVGLIRLHYMVADDLLKNGYREVEEFAAFGAKGAGGSLADTTFYMLPTRNVVTGNIAGYRGSPYLKAIHSDKAQDKPSWMFGEGTSKDDVKASYVTRWITMSDTDFKYIKPEHVEEYIEGARSRARTEASSMSTGFRHPQDILHGNIGTLPTDAQKERGIRAGTIPSGVTIIEQ